MCRKHVEMMRLGLVFALLFPLAVCSGCGSAKLTILMSSDSGGAKAVVEQIAAKAAVAVADIQSLTVSVTGVVLDQLGGSQVELVVTPQDVDLVQLAGVSGLLTSAEVPAGVYTKIRLDIATPRLVLISDPATVLTDIHLTANARMFVETRFAILANTNTNIVLDFGGIHLVQQGNGGYTLTPQLRADVRVELVPVSNQGTVVSVNSLAGTMVLAIGDSNVTVNIAAADIYLPGDTDIPTGGADDLVTGTWISVEGTVNADGVIMATALAVLPAPAT